MGPPALTCTSVGFRFSTMAEGERVFHSLTFAVHAQSIVAIVGPSGSGKTTLLDVIAGDRVPAEGSVCLASPEAEDRPTFARLFQDARLVPFLTVAENVDLATELAGSPERADAPWYRSVGIDGLQRRYPAELSGGEAQRVALLRAMAVRPRLLLADEPTASLDLGNSVVVAKALRELTTESDTAVVVATHDPSVVAIADVVELGTIIR